MRINEYIEQLEAMQCNVNNLGNVVNWPLRGKEREREVLEVELVRGSRDGTRQVPIND